MLISSSELPTQVLNMFDDAKDNSNNGPAYMLAQIFKTLGWTKQPNFWLCDRENDTTINFMHASKKFMHNEISRSMRWSLTNNIPINREDLNDLRGNHIDVAATTCCL